jgi:hypothetical protein
MYFVLIIIIIIIIIIMSNHTCLKQLSMQQQELFTTFLFV